MSLLRHSFTAMGTDCGLVVSAAPSDTAIARCAIGAALAELTALERALSRFDANSGLSHLNAASGSWVAVDERLFHGVKAAVEARETTGGRFDPTVLPALVAAGYDRTFDEIAPDDEATRTPPRPCRGGVRVEGSRIELEPGFHLDLGGIAKGYAVDRACTLLSEAGPCLVNAGGDLAGSGRLWPVGVETADGELTLGLEDGALATSGRDRRRWRRDGREQHHLIDPATGAPAESELLRVTALGRTAAEAEVLAKAIFLGAPAETPAVLVTTDGRTVLAGGLE
jgi:FAD:protein FMN transferase